MMQFESSQAPGILGPLLVEKALSDIPVFGPDHIDIAATVEEALRRGSEHPPTTVITNAIDAPLPDSFHSASTVSGKLRSLRTFVREQLEYSDKLDALHSQIKALKDGVDEIAIASDGIGSCRELHETLLSTLIETPGLPSEAQSIVDHTMLLRAKEKYLFDAATNRNVVSDDPWTRFAWDWIAGEFLSCFLPFLFVLVFFPSLQEPEMYLC